jgi:hypothetical protein
MAFWKEGEENKIALCRRCLLQEFKNQVISKLPKHEKIKIEQMNLEQIWLIPDKKLINMENSRKNRK